VRSEPELTVVIPVYRSEAYLERTVHELSGALEREGSFEIVLVNDASPDGVQRVIDRLCAEDGRVRGFSLRRNAGQHRATLHGFAAARGSVVVTVDDDGQNPPGAVIAVARALAEHDADVVYGRFASVEQSRHRRLASRVNRWISHHTLGNTRGLAISNVRAIRGDLARAVGSAVTPYPYIDALLFAATRHIEEIEVDHRPRERGESTYRLGTLLRLWLAHITSLTVLPLQIATIGSFAASVLGLVAGVLQLVRVLVERRAPPGWLSIFCALTFLFSMLFAFLGIISLYLGRMYVTMNSRGFLWARSTASERDADTGEKTAVRARGRS
jgi:polyisoprenyl-phosphate glycosyltransferase